MPFTSTEVDKNITGKNREHIFDVTADANSGVIDSKMGLVLGIAISPISMASASEAKLKANLNAASATSNGQILASGFTAGDRFFVTVKGR